MPPIYLDYNASTPLDSQILKVLIKELETENGNASSTHSFGRKCFQQLENSRQIIAKFLNVRPREVIFTSGGTEGAALLLQGYLSQHPKCHVISSGTEHACVYQTLKEYQKRGIDVSFLPSGLRGSVAPEDVKKMIRPETRLITLMAVNNETGVRTDVEAIAAIAHYADIPFIVDGIAWLGKEKINLPAGISAIFFSGHKIYAPKGVGFCICRPNLKLTPLFLGGNQEYNRRAGTENLPGIVALAEAIRLLEENQDQWIEHMRQLRELFESELLKRKLNIIINGSGPRVCNVSNVAFPGVDGETFLMQLDGQGIAASHGSACASGALEPSRVLLEMGVPLSLARSSLRFSIGRTTTKEEILRAVQIIEGILS